MNILITGVTSGIGLALTKEFSNNGHTIIGCSRNLSKIEDLKLLNPQNHFLTQLDVSNDVMVKNWAQEVYKKYGKVDVVINNAGIKSQLLPIWKIPKEEFEQTIKTNVFGVVNIIRHFVPKMITNKSGIVINVTSEWGKYADAYVSSYCASKFAVEAITQSLAKELPHGMLAVALNPYFVRTKLLESCKGLFLPGEYELSIDPDSWAKFSASKILEIDYAYNGKSITIHPLAPNMHD